MFVLMFEDIHLVMFDYRITSVGDGFRIALIHTDRNETMIGGFFTVADAKAWLTDHPSILVRPAKQEREDTP